MGESRFSDSVRILLRNGGRLDITAVAGRNTRRLSPLFGIMDAHTRSILLIGIRRGDIVIQYRITGAEFRLDEPFLFLPSVLASVSPGDTLAVSLWKERRELCARVNRDQACGLGFSP